MVDRLIKDCVFAAIDFESAGAERGETDQPVQIGIARSESFDSPPDCWVSYISPGKRVLWSASQIHGITTEMLSDAPIFMNLWRTINSKLAGSVIVGHNLATERRYLRQFPGHRFGPWLDTLSLSKQCVQGLEHYSLQSVAEALDLVDAINLLVVARTWHDALYDAVASLMIVKKIIRELDLFESPLSCFGASLKE